MTTRSDNRELFSALFLIVIFSVYVITNLAIGFNLGFYCLVAVIALFLGFINPRSALWSIIFLTLFFAKQFTLSGLIINQAEYKFYLIDILLLALYARVALDWLASSKRQLNLTEWILILFFAWTALVFAFSMAFWDGQLSSAFSSLKNYSWYPALALAAWYLCRDQQTLKRCLFFFFSGAVTSLIFLVYGLITGQGLWTELTPLTTAGTRFLDFDHAFYLALALVLGLPFIIFQRDRWVNLLVWLMPIFLFGVIASLMRHLWLALLIYLFWLLLALGHYRVDFKKWLMKYLAVGVLVLSLGLFIAMIIPRNDLVGRIGEQQGYFVTRVASFFDSEDSSFAWRSSLWQAVWQDYKSSPWTGLGMGQRVFIDMGVYKDYIELRNIHNSFLAITVQLGLVGILLLAIYVLWTVTRVVRRQPRTGQERLWRLSLLGMIVFCSVAFLFQPYLEANWFSVWWWLALGLSKNYYEGSLS